MLSHTHCKEENEEKEEKADSMGGSAIKGCAPCTRHDVPVVECGQCPSLPPTRVWTETGTRNKHLAADSEEVSK